MICVQACLNSCEILPNLLAAQALDEWDIEGVEPLYRHAMHHVASHVGAAVNSFFYVALSLPSLSWLTRTVAHQLLVFYSQSASARLCRFDGAGQACAQRAWAPCCVAGEHAGHQPMCAAPAACPWMLEWRAAWPADSADASDADIDRWARAQSGLHAGSWASMGAVLRNYMIAVAAKDCSIMLAVARSDMHASNHAVASHVAPCEACELQLRRAQRHLVGDASTGLTRSPPEKPHECVARVSVRGQNFVYRLGLVDFDRKPLSKIAEHRRKDEDILRNWFNSSSSGELGGPHA